MVVGPYNEPYVIVDMGKSALDGCCAGLALLADLEERAGDVVAASRHRRNARALRRGWETMRVQPKATT